VLLALKNELQKYDDYKKWIEKGKEEKLKEIEKKRKEFVEKNPVIAEINIVGNKKIETKFIKDYLQIKVGDTFSKTLLQKKISDLYALNYFETVNYSLSKTKEGELSLSINIHEKRFNKMVAGFRYDDHFKLVGLFGVETNSAFIKGAQMEAYVRFGGLTQFDITVLYPTRSMDIPVYPFIQAGYKDLPIYFYFEEKKLFSYNNRSAKLVGGLNFSLSKFWDLETSMFLEKMNVTTDIATEDIDNIIRKLHPEAEIVAGKAKLLFDSLDDAILPNSGIFVKASLEISSKEIGSDIQYHKYSAYGRFFLPIAQRHTLILASSYAFASSNTPFYKWYYIGGPNSFVGIDYFQANGSEFTIGQIGYRYELLSDIYIKGLYNVMFNYNMGEESIPLRGKPILGGGISFIMRTMFGRAELMWSRGHDNMYAPGEMSNKIYFSFGYNLF
jgi:NTE family protein